MHQICYNFYCSIKKWSKLAKKLIFRLIFTPQDFAKWNTLLRYITIHSWNALLMSEGEGSPNEWGGGVGPSKNWVTWEVPKSLLERGITLKRGRGWCRNWRESRELPLFYYFTVQLHLLCVGEKKNFLYYILVFQSFELTMQNSHPSPFIILKHCIICIFLIHSDSLRRLLTALFKLVWDTQKSTRTNFFQVPRQDVS